METARYYIALNMALLPNSAIVETVMDVSYKKL